DAEDRARYTDAGQLPAGETAPPDYTGTEVSWCPGIAARNWQNDAWSPRTGLLYTSTSTGCARMIVVDQEYVPGEAYRLRQVIGQAPVPRTGPDGEPVAHSGELQANNPATSTQAWNIPWRQGNSLPVMATATDLLFMGGNHNGTMMGIDATNGDIVWEFRTGSRFNATPMTYLGPDGRQSLAVIASSAANNSPVAVDAAADNANRYRRSGSTLYVFALPDNVAAN